MRVIIAGSRSITDYETVKQAIKDSGFDISLLVCGTAKGVDTLGEDWAIENHIPIEYHPADWRRYGMAAGPIRNRWMAESADALIAIWDGQSVGTASMIYLAQKRNLKIFVHQLP